MSRPIIFPPQSTPVSAEGSRLLSNEYWLQLYTIAQLLRGLPGGAPGSAVVLDAQGNPAAGKIDVANPLDITASGFAQWSVAAWDSVNGAFAPKPAPFVVQAGANTALGIAYADVTGATFNLTAGLWRVTVCARILHSVAAGGVNVALNVGGTDIDYGILGFPNPVVETGLATGAPADVLTGTYFQQWPPFGLTATTIIKLRGLKLINAGAAFAGGPNTIMIGQQVG